MRGAIERVRICLLAIVLGLTSAACAPRVQDWGPRYGAPDAAAELREESWQTPDGITLGLQSWLPEAPPRAVIIGLHGMNDYANTFAMPGPVWAADGIAVYAYDQRGFGRSPQRGIWPGDEKLVADLASFVGLMRAEHPGVPIYIVGVSMGGAVAISTLAERELEVDGVVLVAPAVWGWSVLPFPYRATLWLVAHTAPGSSFTGSGLQIWPSDNIEMLRALGRDKQMIFETRADAIYGLVGLMDRAYLSAPEVNEPALYLYGEKDEIIPKGPTKATIARWCGPLRVVVYEKGWHMLLRDLQAERVWADIARFTRDPAAALPSGEEQDGLAGTHCPRS